MKTDSWHNISTVSGLHLFRFHRHRHVMHLRQKPGMAIRDANFVCVLRPSIDKKPSLLLVWNKMRS